MTDPEADPSTFPLWLGGRPVRTEARLDVRDKWSGEVFARAALADRAVLERAIDAAVAGFRELRTWPAWRRAAVLRSVADAIEAERDRFARALVQEAGKPIQFAAAEIDRALDTLRLGAEEATRIRGEHIPLVGFFAAGEIARHHLYGYTGVLTVFTANAEA